MHINDLMGYRIPNQRLGSCEPAALVLSRVLLLLLRLVVEQEGEVVSATNVVDVDADSDTELSPRTRRIRVVCS